MKAIPIVAVVAVLLVLRFRRLLRRRASGRPSPRAGFDSVTSDVGLVALRELQERFRGRIFRVGTLLMLAVVAAAIIIPTLDRGKAEPLRVGLVGALSAPARAAVVAAADSVGMTVQFVPEASEGAAHTQLRSGDIGLAIIEDRAFVVNTPISSTDTSASSQFVFAAARDLGVISAVEAAHLTPAQSSQLAAAKALPVSSLQPGKAKGPVQGVSIIGLILTFVMLSQYNTWILMGVMEEKSSRVIEVLLSAVRPIQLLTGKVLGIGLVAFAQATLIVVVALVLAKSVGSDLLHGTAPVVLVSTLAWLVLGYAFYCWVYAAAGSTAERQDQVQTLAFPLSVPLIFGYVASLTEASSGNPADWFKVLAYLPPTAPFAMPVLVGLDAVSWWEFLASAVISVLCTVAIARLATGIYRRAILRTGGRVRLRDVLG